ncbi:hypothetical protein [Corynebacterium kutscheri]|uniref:hypothetical protein n=1 Tax=Corynebacterium kutscheri TaxID=35755 RepID=UPI000ADEDE11|nr:hypothetical protein [Corynebacterium kutscheri]
MIHIVFSISFYLPKEQKDTTPLILLENKHAKNKHEADKSEGKNKKPSSLRKELSFLCRYLATTILLRTGLHKI